jgi:hemoglobin
MSQSIYDKYGGLAAITGIVQSFYAKVARSAILEPYFRRVDMQRLMDHQTAFLCKVLGGPDNYTGKDLRTAHAKLSITSDVFAEVATLLHATLEEAGVERPDIDAILSVVAGARGDIVTERAASPA